MHDKDSFILWCWIFREGIKHMFQIRVAKLGNVGSLKEEIASKNPNSFQNLNSCLIQLWQVSIANDSIEELGCLEKVEDVWGAIKLKTHQDILDVFMEPPDWKQLHIIVTYLENESCM